MRATAVFDHSIHYGVFCAGVFGLVWFSEEDLVKRLIRVILVAGATFFSLSSAPLLGVGIILVGALWERTTRSIPSRVWLTIAVISVLYLFVSLVATRSPIKILATSIVFDASTGYYRTLIWEYGMDNLWRHPWIGNSLGLWDRPAWMVSDSVDNYWLFIAMWGGLPSAVLYVLSIVGLLRAAHSRPPVPEQSVRRRCRYAWSAAVLALCLMGATAHYWSVLLVYFTFVLGLGGWLADERRGYLSRT